MPDFPQSLDDLKAQIIEAYGPRDPDDLPGPLLRVLGWAEDFWADWHAEDVMSDEAMISEAECAERVYEAKHGVRPPKDAWAQARGW
jgi:hypothetical protein